MFVAASTRCYADKSFSEACQQLTELEFDKVEIWLDESGEHLKPSEVVADPEGFYTRYRESTRLNAVAFSLGNDLEPDGFSVLCRVAKQLRITQITVPPAPLGTPFNAEIDRLKGYLRIASQDGIRVSVPTRTGHLTEDPHTAVELCQATPGLGLTLDPSYFICGPHRGQPYDQVYPHVYHVLLRDTTAEQIQVRIGLGDIDYSRLISQLNRHKYNRILSVELFPELTDDAQRPVELRKMRLLLESLL